MKLLSTCFSRPLYLKVQPVHSMLTVSLPSDFYRAGSKNQALPIKPLSFVQRASNPVLTSLKPPLGEEKHSFPYSSWAFSAKRWRSPKLPGYLHHTHLPKIDVGKEEEQHQRGQDQPAMDELSRARRDSDWRGRLQCCMHHWQSFLLSNSVLLHSSTSF